MRRPTGGISSFVLPLPLFVHAVGRSGGRGVQKGSSLEQCRALVVASSSVARPSLFTPFSGLAAADTAVINLD